MSNELVVKYLSGNCSESEKSEMEQWLAISVQNREKFENLKSVWMHSAKRDAIVFDVEAALSKVNARIGQYELSTKFLPSGKSAFRQYARLAMAVAAVFIAGIVSVHVYNLSNQQDIITVEAATNKSQVVELPDGTKVFLNADAKISYPEAFSKTNRKVSFDGEAYFEVTPDKSKPFIITATNIGVEVLGTTFNLKAISKSNEYQLDLKSGKVLLYSIDPVSKSKLEQIILLPGERGILNPSSYALLKKNNLDENYLAWHTGILEFENISLAEVVKVLQQTYGVNISIDPSLGDLLLTARFEHRKIESILETLHIIFGCQIEKNGSFITIK
jgi:ferric-dicitrate binding protein FerR (iron transport regulator)